MDIKTLKEEYAKLFSETNKAVSEAAKAGKFSAEDKQSNEARYARMEEIKSVLDADKASAKFALDNEKSEEFAVRKDAVNGEKFDERKAFEKFLVTGERHKELFTIDSTTGSGVLVPTLLQTPIAIRKHYNAVRAAVAARNGIVYKSSALVNYSVPVFDDTTPVGATQSESATSQTISEPTVSGISLAPNLYTSKGVWFSETTMTAPGGNITELVVPALTKRVDLYQESAWVTHLKTLTTGAITSASATALTFAEVQNWIHSLAVPYRSDAVAIVSDSFYKLIRGLADTTGRPLLELDPSSMLQTLYGIPIFISGNLDAYGTTAKTVGVMASAESLCIYDAGQPHLKRYIDDKDMPDQTGFELFVNGDFKGVQSGVKLFKTLAA